MTPVAYLTRLRLHRVRHALRTATQASTTVTTEALRWGFWHFGDFSRAYKPEFGITELRERRYSPQIVIGKEAKLERIPWIGKLYFVTWTTIVGRSSRK